MEGSNTVIRLSIPNRGGGKSPEKGQRGNLAETEGKKKKKKKNQDEDKKSAINKTKINSQIKKPHLQMIPIDDNYKIRYRPDYGRPDKENK